MEATGLTLPILIAYFASQILLLPLRVVNKLRGKSMGLSYSIFIPTFLLILVGLFVYIARDIDIRYANHIVTGVNLLLAFIAMYVLLLPIRVIKKVRGKDMALNITVYEVVYFFMLFGITFLNAPQTPDTPRGRVVMALMIGLDLKTPIAEFYSDNGRYPNNDELRSFGKPLDGRYVQKVIIDQDGRIIATLKKGMFKHISGKSVIFTPHNGGQTWDCYDGDMPDKYRAVACIKK